MIGSILAAGILDAADLNVPIRVVERAGIERKAEPVIVGVPIPKGTLQDVNGLTLVGPDGKDVSAQFGVATYWWHTAKGKEGEKSVKWVHVDFQADAPVKGSLVYTLKSGGTGSAKDSPLKAALDGDRVTVETGKMKFTVRGDKFNVLDEVWIGGEQVVKGHADGVILLSSFDGAEKNSIYTASKAPAKLEIETAGPERVVVLARGKLARADGTAGPDSLFDFDCRISAFKNKSYVEVEFVYYDKCVEEKKGISSRVPMDGLIVEVPTVLAAPIKCRLGKSGGEVEASLGEQADKAWVFAKGSDAIEFGGKAAGEAKGKSGFPDGARDEGRLVAATEKLSVGAGIRWFWQINPKAVEMDGAGKLTIHLWPNIGREVRKVPSEYAAEKMLVSRAVPGRANIYLGMSHTYRFFLSFGVADGAVANEAWWRINQPLRGVCAPKWYCEDTRVFGPAGSSTESLYEPERWKMVADYDKRVREWHDFIAYERRKTNYGSEDGFGEFNFGDHVNYDYDKTTDKPLDILWDNNYYGFPHACIMQFARTADLAYLDTGHEFGTHLQDIDMMCAHPKAHMLGCQRYSPSAAHVFSDHDISRQYFGGKENQQVYASDTYNHFKNQELFERWYLLGDRHALEMGLLSAGFVVNNGRNALSQGRSVGHGIVGSLSAWHATGEKKYLDAAGGIVEARKGFTSANGAWQDGIAAEGFAGYYYETGSQIALEAAKRAANTAYGKKDAAGSMLHAFGFVSAQEGDPAILELGIKSFQKAGTPKKSWGSVMDFGNSLRNMGWFTWYLEKGERKVTAEAAESRP